MGSPMSHVLGGRVAPAISAKAAGGEISTQAASRVDAHVVTI
jgi:hypothetical protein